MGSPSKLSYVKNGILVYQSHAERFNLGDWIQSLAQRQFVDDNCIYIERESTSSFYTEGRVGVVMSAWFMFHPENFPPSDCIIPFFISFHIRPDIEKKIMNDNVVSYLKKYEPIGARDISTKNILSKYGIKSYFSACSTLTLGKHYRISSKRENVYFVDPYYEFGGNEQLSAMTRIIKSTLYYLSNILWVEQIQSSFIIEKQQRRLCKFAPIQRRLMAACFFHAYGKVFDRKLLTNSKFLTHSIRNDHSVRIEDKLLLAEEYIKIYSQAQLVVTSRIHCALPCLSLDTPVIFVTSDALQNGKRRTRGRLDGLLELFHVIKWESGNNMKILTKCFNGKINSDTIIENKGDYIKYMDKINNDISDFWNRLSLL